jgi:hypothetical protein
LQHGGAYGFVPFGTPPITVPSRARPNYDGGKIQRVDLETGAVTLRYGLRGLRRDQPAGL